ncbi:MAG: hypothetical protein V2A71_02350 [Candidatus Eisenbacteria bacterium]
MVHRKAVVAMVFLAALFFLSASYLDAGAGTLGAKHRYSAEESIFVSFRHGGSVFSTCGDPDEIATANSSTRVSTHKTSGLGGPDGYIRACPNWTNNWNSVVLGNHGFLQYLLHRLEAGALGVH